MQVYYYSDEVRDDFAGTKIKTIPLTEKYKYHTKNPLIAIRKFIFYRCIVTPLAFVYCKLIRRIKYVNKKCMKGYRRTGCFIYGNHTSFVCDASNPICLSYPRPAEVVVNEDSTSIKGIRWLVKDLGAMPIPSSIHLMGKFNEAIEYAIAHRHWVAIYPEAHIWPYYTGIRSFPAVSFRYPAKCGAPVFSYTMTYSKRKHSKRPKITVYIDGPFFADKELPVKKAAQKLRDEVYSAMKARADAHSDYKYKFDYVYRPAEENGGKETSEGES